MSYAMRITKIAVRVFGAVSLISSFVFLALGDACYNRDAHFKRAAAETQGVVIEMKERSSDVSRSGTVFYPVIRFADKAGREHTLYSNATASSRSKYAVGDHVSVLYDPANPNNARVNSFISLWMGPLMLGFLGGWNLLIGLLLLIALPLLLRWAERRTAIAGPP